MHLPTLPRLAHLVRVKGRSGMLPGRRRGEGQLDGKRIDHAWKVCVVVAVALRRCDPSIAQWKVGNEGVAN